MAHKPKLKRLRNYDGSLNQDEIYIWFKCEVCNQFHFITRETGRVSLTFLPDGTCA